MPVERQEGYDSWYDDVVVRLIYSRIEGERNRGDRMATRYVYGYEDDDETVPVYHWALSVSLRYDFLANPFRLAHGQAERVLLTEEEAAAYVEHGTMPAAYENCECFKSCGASTAGEYSRSEEWQWVLGSDDEGPT